MRPILLFIAHFIADFLLQSRKIGENKSNNFSYLIAHIGVLTCVMLVAAWFVFDTADIAIKFALYNSIVHLTIDASIWNVYKLSVKARNRHVSYVDLQRDWKYWKDYWFYTTIGFDQMLHTVTIIYFWTLLTRGQL